MIISIFKEAGTFAENKDVARSLRLKKILPTLKQGKNVTLDFQNVEAATQSFIHALISDVLRIHGNGSLDHMTFKSCNQTIQKIIRIVVEYMQEGMES